MKRTIIILAMLLIAATAYNQTSRKPANTETTARKTTREVAGNTRPSHERTTNVDARQRTSQSSTTRTSRTAVPKTRSETSSNDRAYTRSSSNYSNSSSRTSGTRPDGTRTSTNRTVTSRTNTPVQQSSNRTRTVDRTSYHSTNSNNQANHEANRARTETRHAHVSPRMYTEKHSASHYYHNKPSSRYYRAKHYAYRAPVELRVMWTPTMHRHYARMYPSVSYWNYRNGHHINMVSTYFADYYIGDVMTVYGQVTEVFYSRATDEYFLYFGLYYPHQDFTMVLPGRLARRYSHHPERYFTDRYIASTGLVTNFGGEAEIVVRESFQLHLY